MCLGDEASFIVRFTVTVKSFTFAVVPLWTILNVLIATFLSWLSLRHQEVVPLQAPTEAMFDPSMGGDLLVGSFLLGMILTLVLTFVTRLNLKKKQVESLVLSGWFSKIPKNVFLRSLLVGLFLTLTMGLAVTVALGALDIVQMPVWTYIALHAIYVGALAWFVTALVVKRALADLTI